MAGWWCLCLLRSSLSVAARRAGGSCGRRRNWIILGLFAWFLGSRMLAPEVAIIPEAPRPEPNYPAGWAWWTTNIEGIETETECTQTEEEWKQSIRGFGKEKPFVGCWIMLGFMTCCVFRRAVTSSGLEAREAWLTLIMLALLIYLTVLAVYGKPESKMVRFVGWCGSTPLNLLCTLTLWGMFGFWFLRPELVSAFFSRDVVLFSNDGPLGYMNSAVNRDAAMPGAHPWNNLWWVGGDTTGPSPPNFTYFLMMIFYHPKAVSTVLTGIFVVAFTVWFIRRKRTPDS
jgi:hypothetical protein